MKLTKDQKRSLRGQVKWIDEQVSRQARVRVLICAHPTAIRFMERCGLLEDRIDWIGTLNAEGRRVFK